jgi:hypothetical protein
LGFLNRQLIDNLRQALSSKIRVGSLLPVSVDLIPVYKRGKAIRQARSLTFRGLVLNNGKDSDEELTP